MRADILSYRGLLSAPTRIFVHNNTGSRLA